LKLEGWLWMASWFPVPVRGAERQSKAGEWFEGRIRATAGWIGAREGRGYECE